MNDLARLLEAMRDGVATPEELVRLSELLDSREARQAVADDLRFDYALQECLRQVKAVERTPIPGRQTARLIRVGESRRAAASRRRKLEWLVAAAAVLVLASGLLWSSSGQHPAGRIQRVDPQAVAIVLRGGEKSAATAGMALMPGDRIELGAGAAVNATLWEGAQLEIGSGALLSIGRSAGAAHQLDLDSGHLAVDSSAITEAGRSLRINTPFGEVQPQGTRFEVDVDIERTRLQVHDGLVRFSNTRGDLLVHAGESGEAFAHSAPQRPETKAEAKPLTGDIVLRAGDGKIVGVHWRLVDDASTASGKALEASAMMTMQETDALKKTGALGHVEFTINPEPGVRYNVWIRARCSGEDPAVTTNSSYDGIELTTPDGVFTPGKEQRGIDPDLRHFIFTGYGTLPGYWWIGGRGESANVNEFDDLPPVLLEFDKPGPHVIRLLPFETPMRVDAIWLAREQRERPEPGDLGPR